MTTGPFVLPQLIHTGRFSDLFRPTIASFVSTLPLKNIGGPDTCISKHDLASVGKNLAKACPGAKGQGGCYVFSYGVSLCLLDPDSEDSCHPLLGDTR